MSAFIDKRAVAFRAMLAQWGTTLIHNGLEAECLADPQESVSQNQRVGQMPARPAKFSLLREDVERIGLLTTVGQPRQVVTNNERQFEIFAVVDDPADATIDFRATLKL